MSRDMGAGGTGWLDDEIVSAGLPDKRLARRLRRLLDQMSAAPGQPVPAACGDWAATKAAYRFFDNPRVTEHGVLAGHFAATAARCAASEGPILILQDTTEFIYSRAHPGKIGFTKTINAGRYKAGQPNVVTLCGVLMHSSLAVTLKGSARTDGGEVLDTHEVQRDLDAQAAREPHACADRDEGKLSLAGEPAPVDSARRRAGALRACGRPRERHLRTFLPCAGSRHALSGAGADQSAGRRARRRRAGGWDASGLRPALGRTLGGTPSRQDQPGRNGVRACEVCCHRNLAAKRKRYSPQLLTYIHALEIDPPADRPPIDWKLVTNLPVGDLSGAVEKLGWYALRWKAEVFHKVMKSGCRAEEARLETAERLAKFLALIAVVSWRIFFLTMSARARPEAAPETALTPAEIATLDGIDAARAKPRILRRTLATYLLQIAMLGGYLARNHDPPPGNMVVWRGLTRLNDIALGISIGTRRRCG